MSDKAVYIDDCIAAWARARPDDLALDFRGQLTTWRQLERMVEIVAARLGESGVGAGDRIAFLARNSDFEIVVFFATARLRATFLPLNWRLAESEINWILNNADPRLVIASDEFRHLLEDGASHSRRPILRADNGCAEIGRPGRWLAPPMGPSRAPAAVDPGRAIAAQLYTSGTTGRPKGAMLSHAYFVRGADLVLAHPEAALRLAPGEQALLTMPLFHVGGLNFAFILMSQGRGLVVLPEYDVNEVLDLIDRGRVSLVTGVPTMLQALLDHPRARTTNFSALKGFMYGAAAMPPALVERAMRVMNCGFASTYGLTESSSLTYLAPSDHCVEGNARMTSVGRPLPGVELRIVGSDGAPAAAGEVGEITVRSPQMMVGYWNLPEATAAAFVDGWFRTGDAGALDVEGYLHLKDRIKDMIVSGGENIYPAEVESVLYEHPAIREVAVVGVRDSYWGERPKAFVVLNEGATLSLDELRDFAATRLARFKLPKALALMSELPRTSSGKVLKRELRELDAS